MFNFKFNFNFVPVSSDFIENYMTAANGEYVKVYLYILNMAVKGVNAEPRLIARRLNMLESDVLNVIDYWQEKGLISADGSTITIGASIDGEEQVSPGPESVPEENSKSAYFKPVTAKKTAAQINTDPLVKERLAEITQMSQEILGKTLNDNDISTLYWFDEELDFSPELIMILLEYCVSKGKKDMRYVEKVAIAWHENGIRDIETADRYIAEEADSKKLLYELKNIFGIKDRAFSKTEEAFIRQWNEKCGMDANMIALAYEYCIMATNKLSFQYMDRIIQNWKKAGISTIDAAEKDHENFKNKNKRFSDKDSSVYKPNGTDYADLERRMNEKY